MGLLGMLREPFVFVDSPPGVLVDEELELVEPEARWIDEVLRACHHPHTQREMPQQARMSRAGMELFLRQQPRGRQKEEKAKGVLPGYTFWMRIRPEHFRGPAASLPPVLMAGSVSFRVGSTPTIDLYYGHFGYHVFPPARGHRYAERSCRLLFGLARAHGFKSVWITCNPDNIPSRRTCERLGGTMVGIVPVPPDNALYLQGDREKCRYLVEL